MTVAGMRVALTDTAYPATAVLAFSNFFTDLKPRSRWWRRLLVLFDIVETIEIVP